MLLSSRVDSTLGPMLGTAAPSAHDHTVLKLCLTIGNIRDTPTMMHMNIPGAQKVHRRMPHRHWRFAVALNLNRCTRLRHHCRLIFPVHSKDHHINIRVTQLRDAWSWSTLELRVSAITDTARV